MRGKKNKLLKQSFCIIGLITAISIEADSSLNSSLNKHQETFENAAMQIWNWAEVGYQEYKSAKLLKDELKANGFTIQSGVADIPTAFIAEFSNGGPVIGILGEYDALPGIDANSLPFQGAKR
jgi:aminobenzoyl-glutamate utilization protein B